MSLIDKAHYQMGKMGYLIRENKKPNQHQCIIMVEFRKLHGDRVAHQFYDTCIRKTYIFLPIVKVVCETIK